MIGPYTFIRTVTLALGVTWTLTGIVRIVDRARDWQRRLAPVGSAPGWWRKQVVVVCLRATVLDPLNLALLCALVALWTLPLPR